MRDDALMLCNVKVPHLVECGRGVVSPGQQVHDDDLRCRQPLHQELCDVRQPGIHHN